MQSSCVHAVEIGYGANSLLANVKNVRYYEASYPLNRFGKVQIANSDVVFVAEPMLIHSLVQLSIEIAKRNGRIIVGLIECDHGLREVAKTAEIVSKLRYADTTILVDSNKSRTFRVDAGKRLDWRNTISSMCEALSSPTNGLRVRALLRNGRLGRISTGESSSRVEKAMFRAMRVLPFAEFAYPTHAYVDISGQVLDRGEVANAIEMLTRSLPEKTRVTWTTQRTQTIGVNVGLLITGLALPFVSARISLDLQDLEQESTVDDDLRIELPLDQMEPPSYC